MPRSTNDISLAELLEPILDAADASDDVLDGAVTGSAEVLAFRGALVVDGTGRPAPGVTDDMAVLGALRAYGRTLLSLGEVDTARTVTRVVERIHHRALVRQPRPRHSI